MHRKLRKFSLGNNNNTSVLEGENKRCMDYYYRCGIYTVWKNTRLTDKHNMISQKITKF